MKNAASLYSLAVMRISPLIDGDTCKNCGNFQNYSFNAGIIQYWPRVTHRRKSMIPSSVFYVQLSILSLSPQTCQDILCLQISTEAWKKTAVKSMELYVPADTVAFYLIASKNTKKINHYLWDVHKHQNWQCPLHFSHLNKLDILIKLHSPSKKKIQKCG